METAAVFWESVIGTYGIDRNDDYVMLDGDLFPERYARWCERLEEMEESGLKCGLLQLQAMDSGALRGRFLISGNRIDEVEPGLFFASHGITPVDLIHFQGPHFGDRYGIADAAHTALEDGGIDYLSSVFSGASVFIVLPRGRAAEAVGALLKRFKIPGGKTEND